MSMVMTILLLLLLMLMIAPPPSWSCPAPPPPPRQRPPQGSRAKPKLSTSLKIHRGEQEIQVQHVQPRTFGGKCTRKCLHTQLQEVFQCLSIYIVQT